MEYRFYLYHQDIGRWTSIVDPLGWDAFVKNNNRYGDGAGMAGPWHGIFFTFNTKLRFVKDGKNFVQGYYELYGIEQDILLRVERRNLLTRKFEVYYEGRLNLHVYNTNTTYVECNVEQTGFIQRLKNGSDIKTEVNYTDIISLHSKVLRRQTEKKPNATVDEVDFANLDFQAGMNYLMFSFNPLNTDEIEGRFDYGNQVSTLNPVENLKYIYKVKEDGHYTFNTRPIYTISTSGSKNWEVKWWLVTGRPGNYVYQQIGSTGVFSGFALIQDYPELTDYEVDLLKDDEVYLYAEIDVNIGGTFTYLPYWFTSPIAPFVATFKMVADTTFKETTTKAIMLHEAFSQVAASITGSTAPFYSEYYGRTDIGYAADGAGALRAITNVKQLRGIDRPITCTMADLVKVVWALDGVGVGIEKVNGTERVRIEPITHWYQAKRMMRLSFVLDIEKAVLGELYFNQLDAGYDKWANEQITNLDEFNASREFTLPITQVKNKLDIKCPYITSGFTIEFARRSSVEPSKDTRYDDDNVIINVVRDGSDFVAAKDEAFDSVTGIISPETAYNLEDSPARCLRRHGRVLRSFLNKQLDKYIRFADGAANTQMVSTLTGGQPVDEDGDVLISTLDKPLYLAEVYSFRANLTAEQLAALNETDPDADANVWGFVEFSDNDRNWKRGYLLSAAQEPDSNEVKFQLIKANI